MTVAQKNTVSLLEALGSSSEIRQYLSLFRSAAPSRFAVVKVGGGIIESHLDALTASLSLLHGVGLHPVVVHGAGGQLTAELERRGVKSTFAAGLRVTCPETLSVAREVFQRENARLCRALAQAGAPALPLVSGVLRAERSPDGALGFVGEVNGADLTLVEGAIESGQIPVVSSLAHSHEGQTLNVNADAAARQLAISTRARKVVFLTGVGGLRGPDGSLIPAVNLEEDLDRLLDEGWVDGGMERKLREIGEMLRQMPAASSVSITTPEHLVRELFTFKGHGTLIQRGVRIEASERVAPEREAALKSLLESSFGRALRRDYFERTDIERVYWASDGSAAAIVSKGVHAPYLDKFAVTPEAQGSGIGSSLWSRLVTDCPQLVWRSRSRNPINGWYLDRADGVVRRGEWLVFWRGFTDASFAQACVEDAANRIESFAPNDQAEIEIATGSELSKASHVNIG